MLDEALRAWIDRWVRLAEGDLAMARAGMSRAGFDVFELVGFHAQQTVEKLVKAYLVRKSIEFGDTHDIDRLLMLVRGLEADLAARLDAASALTRYAVGTRYPGRYAPVTREQAERAVQIAEMVHREVLPLVTQADRTPAESLKERLRRQKESRL